jgi:glycerol-3-phosphate dehydrogenase
MEYLQYRRRERLVNEPIRLHRSGISATLDQMSQAPLDVLVVGGGVTGAGVALDAATRGLRVGLVEQDDLASGTSSRSSKMIHGGLRYLRNGQVGVVRESLRERALLGQMAPHLVSPLPIVLPLRGSRAWWQRMVYGSGLFVYDLLGGRAPFGRHHHLRRSRVLEEVPGLRADRLRGGLFYRDGRCDDVRLVVAIVRTAASHGALIASHSRAVSLRPGGATIEHDGRSIEIDAKVVVNATGAWADQLCADTDQASRVQIAPSKGVHLVVSAEQLQLGGNAIVFFAQAHNANVFVEPWGQGLAVIGATDTPHHGPLENPQPDASDVEQLLAAFNAAYGSVLTDDDVIASWAGIRPLVHGSATAPTDKVSRRHLLVSTPGLVTITGGKLTTWRAMAEDAVDAVVRQLGRPVLRCATRDIQLDGAPGASAANRAEINRVLVNDPEAAALLIARHGANAVSLARACARESSLRERIHPNRAYLRVEIPWSAHHELAFEPEDVWQRRTRIAFEIPKAERVQLAALDGLLDLDWPF